MMLSEYLKVKKPSKENTRIIRDFTRILEQLKFTRTGEKVKCPLELIDWMM